MTLTAIQSLQACMVTVCGKRGTTASASACLALELPTPFGAAILKQLKLLLQGSMQRRAVGIAQQKCNDLDEFELEQMVRLRLLLFPLLLLDAQ